MARARWRLDASRRDRGEHVREETFEEIIARAKWDRKGQTIREGCTYSASAVNCWLVRWSVAGRVDQLDLVFSGTVVFTGSTRRLRKIAPWLRV
jgi:hypothetical protein